MHRPTAAFILAAGLAAPSSHAGLPAALDGSWYNPLQSGHGLTLERIDHDSALLFWHVFDPEGRPLTLYIETQIQGDSLLGEVLAPKGMRFGRFEEADLTLPFWGQVELHFTDCAHATLKYDSPVAGYGRGEMPLTRLLSPKDADCALDDPAGLLTLAGRAADGRLVGLYAQGTEGLDPLNAAVLYSGLTKGWVTSDGGLAFASRTFGPLLSTEEFVARGRPLPANAGEANFEMEVYANGWLHSYVEADDDEHPAARRDHFALQLRTHPARAKGFLIPRRLEAGAPEMEVEVTDPRAGLRNLQPGSYRFQFSYPRQGGAQERASFELAVGSDLSLCVRRDADHHLPAEPCLFTGRATLRASEFEFVLQSSAAAPFTGIGQVRNCQPYVAGVCETDLIMVGDNGTTGLRIVVDPFGGY